MNNFYLNLKEKVKEWSPTEMRIINYVIVFKKIIFFKLCCAQNFGEQKITISESF